VYDDLVKEPSALKVKPETNLSSLLNLEVHADFRTQYLVLFSMLLLCEQGVRRRIENKKKLGIGFADVQAGSYYWGKIVESAPLARLDEVIEGLQKRNGVPRCLSRANVDRSLLPLELEAQSASAAAAASAAGGDAGLTVTADVEAALQRHLQRSLDEERRRGVEVAHRVHVQDHARRLRTIRGGMDPASSAGAGQAQADALRAMRERRAAEEREATLELPTTRMRREAAEERQREAQRLYELRMTLERQRGDKRASVVGPAPSEAATPQPQKPPARGPVASPISASVSGSARSSEAAAVQSAVAAFKYRIEPLEESIRVRFSERVLARPHRIDVGSFLEEKGDYQQTRAHDPCGRDHERSGRRNEAAYQRACRVAARRG
jgi:hypothetical protein